MCENASQKALFYAWERYRGKQYGWGTVAVFISFAFVAGSYQTWHDEYARNNSRSTARERHVAQLQKFYSEAGALIDEPLPKGVSEPDVQKYAAKADNWGNTTTQWIEQNMGIPARDRFLDRTGMMAGTHPRAVNPEHNAIIMNLTRHRDNLKQLIENPVWDKGI